MKDLFEKEELVLQHARDFMASLDEPLHQSCRQEYEYLLGEYARVLRQLRWVTRIADLTALGLNTEKTALMNKVNVDALTEIYNRRFLTHNLERYLETLRKEGQWLTVMMLDIDFFKNYNDTYGHPVGDACLRKVADTVRNSLSGAEDFVARYGGEEFIAVLPAANRELGAYVARKILKNVWDLHIPHENSRVADRITLSIGLISAVPTERDTMQAYIDRVDEALYQSKKSGRNRITHLEL